MHHFIMKKYYQVLLSINTDFPIYTYFVEGDFILQQGQIVECPVRKKQVLGIIWEEIVDISQITFDIEKTLAIEKIYTTYLSYKQINFIKVMATQTFNNLGLIIETVLKPFEKLSKSDLRQLEKGDVQDHGKSPQPPLSRGRTNTSLAMRIMYLIRTQVPHRFAEPLGRGKNTNIPNILLLFPEKKLQLKVMKELETELKNCPYLGAGSKADWGTGGSAIQVYQYQGDQTTQSLNTIRNILNLNSNKKVTQKKPPLDKGGWGDLPARIALNIYAGQRSALFLPFESLDMVILVDESNNMYQQEQNFYFDTREAVTWLANSYQCSLKFLSTFPSIRLHNFNNLPTVEKDLICSTENTQNTLRLKLTHFDRKHANNSIFSYPIEEILTEFDEFG
jgi:primosomal protein N'